MCFYKGLAQDLLLFEPKKELKHDICHILNLIKQQPLYNFKL